MQMVELSAQFLMRTIQMDVALLEFNILFSLELWCPQGWYPTWKHIQHRVATRQKLASIAPHHPSTGPMMYVTHRQIHAYIWYTNRFARPKPKFFPNIENHFLSTEISRLQRFNFILVRHAYYCRNAEIFTARSKNQNTIISWSLSAIIAHCISVHLVDFPEK